MTHFWLPCEGLEDSYEISSYGELRSVDRFVIRSDTGKSRFVKGQIIRVETDKYGYNRVKLSYKSKSKCVLIHRLVAQTFIPNPENKPQVNHKDGNKANNSVYNLEWVTNAENQKHAYDTGLREVKSGEKANNFTGTVLAYDKNGKLVAELNGNLDMKNKGFDFQLVSKCLKGQRKTHKGCTFVKLSKELK